MINEVKRQPVQISSYGSGSCTIANLTTKETDVVCGAITNGYNWVRRELNGSGNLEFSPSYDLLPNPVMDEKMYPFWKLPTHEMPVQMEMFDHPGVDVINNECHQSVSITVQHLCGYGYTAETYKTHAEHLQTYGFECLRSQRKDNGQYWELWFLSGLWSAKGELNHALVKSGTQKKNISFELHYIF